ncbi:MAG: heavy metal translocating P-type ATPase metal-binding domain-containing protein [Bacteroidetes bacterium]|nr:heavy metal translocating P-type ATPase metal-binding domain-containing protein [Bacteroidota bacterium]
MQNVSTQKLIHCYHCGDECRNEKIHFDEKIFCCEGCKLVYEILQENNLCTYYNFNSTPGISPKKKFLAERFAFLDEPHVKQKLIHFTDGKTTSITFYVPQMHCSSCIWLLEHLNRINEGVVRSQVNFLKHEVNITYNEERISLRKLVEMLATIGYEPLINLNDLENKSNQHKDKTYIYKIGVAGFCFGNIMLFSFPEYFSLTDFIEPGFKNIFSYINLALSLPVFFYCSAQFFKGAWLGIKQKFLNIDVPIALGILVMFVRSAYEILSATGAGYMDTMAGLVFFMLLGRMFQNKTYDTLSFERDYKSFFPVAVMCRRNGKETSVTISNLKPGERIIIRNEELIPADAVLMKGSANIDYSFVTGEAMPVSKGKGELIYAGGKQSGTAIELEVVKEVSQSYLTQLWNNDAYRLKQDDGSFQLLVNRISHWFTFVIIGIALAALGYWLWRGDLPTGMSAFTAVLIIACPCALAISSPFTLGNILRLFGKNKFYLKNFSVIEKLAKVDTIVFDKTGTLTKSNTSTIDFIGDELSADELKMIRSVVHHSSHPLSQAIYKMLPEAELLAVDQYAEEAGKGIQGELPGAKIKIGSAEFTGVKIPEEDLTASKVYVSVNGLVKGYFSIRNEYRNGVDEMVKKFREKNYHLAVLSGDHEGEKDFLQKLFGKETEIHFHQSPADKLRFIQSLQNQHHKVLMIGDGLNDAGALKQSDVGISISDDVNNFSPACDGILDATRFSWLANILRVSKSSRRIILGSFVIALLYNTIGLWFAVQGLLSPVVAAILMPISSVTIITFTTGVSNLISRK